MATQHPDDPSNTEDLRDRSLGELLKQLSEETTRLVHQELELAKAELTQKGRQAGGRRRHVRRRRGARAGRPRGPDGLLILALNAVMPAWLAALLVAVVYGIIAFVLVKQGQNKMKQASPPVPTQTIETVKEDLEWAKTQMRSDRT